MPAILMLLPWLAPLVGFILLVQEPAEPVDLVLAAPVSLVQAARATESATQGRVVRAYIASRRRPWGYVLVVERHDGPRRYWVDPATGTIERRNPGGSNDPLAPNALPLADLLEAAERRTGGRAMSAEGVTLGDRPAAEIHVATPEGQAAEVYVDAHTGQVLVTLDRPSDG